MFERVHARCARRAQVPTTTRPSTLTRARSSASERSEPERSTHPTRVDFHFAQVPVTSPIPLAGDQPEEQEGMMLGGDATSASTSDLSAAAWTDHGVFKWWIKWVTDGTSGWIVQKITNTYSGTDGAGKAITNATVGVTPSYYEAWEVDAAGGITGSLGATGNRDRWERPGQGASSKGTWSMTGEVYWTAEDPAKSGFKSKAVANAGTLLSSKSAPAKLSGLLLTRTADGAWDSTGKTPTHTGTAK